MLQIDRIVVGEFLTCCYLVSAQADTRAMVIDPGGDARRILAAIDERSLKVEIILNTHGHVDHIAANRSVKEAFSEAKLLIGQKDAPMLGNAMRNLSALFLKRVNSPSPDTLLREGDVVKVGGATGKVLLTPGHTPGGISLYFSAEENDGQPVVFSGDALFQLSIGRTDLPGGDAGDLVRSVRDKLLSLPGETVVYPGHGEPTTVGREVASNPFVSLRTE